jgi:hypothetical protein
MATSNVYTIPNMPLKNNDEALNGYVGDLVRNFQLPVAEIQDSPDSKGNARVRFYGTTEEVYTQVATEIAKRGTP